MKIWQSKTVITYILAPFSGLFWLISQVRHWLYRKKILKMYRAKIPVLIVGNISVGGNGKTPVVVWLVEQLQQRWVKVGVISRGYGGKNRQYPQLVTPQSDPELMGDEPVLIAQRTQAPVAISPNRQQSIELLLSRFQLDLIIADDGLQHYALERDLEWVVIDGERQFGNGFVLPAGGLRELPSRLNSVQAVICNGKNVNLQSNVKVHLMTLAPDDVVNLKTGKRKPLTDFRTQPVVVLAGIGYPPRFFTMLENYGIPLAKKQSFADHQPYTKAMIDALNADNLPLVMTEKDAVKCYSFASENWWYVPVSAKFSAESTACLLEPILKLVRNENE